VIGRLIGKLLGLAGFLLLVLAVVVKVRYGGGAAFPDRTTTPRLQAAALDVVAQLPTPPGNIAVAANGRVFASLHPEARPNIKVVEIVKAGLRPYPNEAFQNGHGEPRYFRSVLSVRIDRQDRLWTLDNANHGMEPARLLAFDIADGKVVHEFEFPRDIAGRGSHLNDFQVAPDGQTIYIADASIFGKTPALVIYDVATKSARRVLQGHPAVTPDNFTPVVQGRKMELFGLFSIRPGVDSIALDRKGEWLYFAPVTSLNLFRVKTADLRNATLPESDLAGRVETYAPKTMSDGITTDDAGNVYLTDPEHSAINVLRADKTLETLVRDDHLRWPDGFSFGPDGWLYVTCSALNQILGRPPWEYAMHAPYQIFRIKPGAEAPPGQ
jgi:sugar lactone lactonase YvrE